MDSSGSRDYNIFIFDFLTLLKKYISLAEVIPSTVFIFHFLKTVDAR